MATIFRNDLAAIQQGGSRKPDSCSNGDYADFPKIKSMFFFHCLPALL
jgi:hypothetical protein